jgi:O-antigen ligase
MVTSLIVLTIAWGALAFGAVYPWAFLPLAVTLLGIAAWQWRPSRPAGLLPWTAVLLVAAVAAQLVPLGVGTLTRISPAALRVVASLDVAVANGFATSHPLSIHPAGTRLALGAVVLALLWIPTCAAILQQPGVLHRLARQMVILGTVVAVIGLAHKATFNGKVLWMWEPEFFAVNSFGPFVNRNHFAGWMLLVLTVTVGMLFGRLQSSGLSAASRLREYVLWIGSSAGTPVLLTAAAALVMASALIWTMSRSGIAAAGVAMTVMCVAAVRRFSTSGGRWLVAGSVSAALIGVVSWRGTDTMVDWYSRTGTLQWRIDLWHDTWPAVREFWLTGAGLNTFGTLFLVQPRTDPRFFPRAAHNDYLQLALEGGLLVGIPALLLAVAIVREIVRGLKAPQDDATWWIRMGAVAGIAGMAIQEISEFSLQVPGVFLLFATLVAIAIHTPAPVQLRRRLPAPQAATGSAPGATARRARSRAAAVAFRRYSTDVLTRVGAAPRRC